MSSDIRDLLPDEVDSESTALPSEIMEYQARRIEVRTQGTLTARVLRTTSDELIELRFELVAPSLDFTSILFKVRHRPEFEYPALIIPPESLPDFLKPTITVTKVRKGPFGSGSYLRPFDEVEEVKQKNHWLASTADEFENKVGEVLRLPEVTSIFTNLRTKVQRPQSAPTETDNSKSAS